MSYKIVFTPQAAKDLKKVSESQYKAKALKLLKLIQTDPFTPPVEKLVDLENVYSRRINIQHRLVYQVYEKEQTIKIIRMWTHYGDN